MQWFIISSVLSLVTVRLYRFTETQNVIKKKQVSKFKSYIVVKDNYTLYKNAVKVGNGIDDKPIYEDGGAEFSPKVRVPSLKRKSAWKRFYRLFPNLKDMKTIHGSMSSVVNGYGKSTIKLK